MLEEILRIENITTNLSGKNKTDVISELVDILYSSDPSFDKEAVKQALMMRELKGSTGIGNHIAIPHAKVNGIDKIMISVGLSKKGIDFESIDGKPVHLIFCIVLPQNVDPKVHLELLKEIVSKYENVDVTELASSVSSPTDLYNLLVSNST